MAKYELNKAIAKRFNGFVLYFGEHHDGRKPQYKDIVDFLSSGEGFPKWAIPGILADLVTVYNEEPYKVVSPYVASETTRAILWKLKEEMEITTKVRDIFQLMKEVS